MLKHKSDAVTALKNFTNLIETQFNAKLRKVRSDNAREFIYGECREFLANKGIVHETSCPDRPQQNGRAERKHKHLLEVARALKL